MLRIKQTKYKSHYLTTFSQATKHLLSLFKARSICQQLAHLLNLYQAYPLDFSIISFRLLLISYIFTLKNKFALNCKVLTRHFTYIAVILFIQLSFYFYILVYKEKDCDLLKQQLKGFYLQLQQEVTKQNIQIVYKLRIVRMFQQTTSTNIRIKKSFPIDNKYLRTGNSLSQTKNSQPFGQLFIQKNNERISQFQTLIQQNKYSQRYLINTNKLQKLNKASKAQKGLLNRSLSNTANNQQYRVMTPIFTLNRTSQSHRSHLMTVNIKQLPKLQPSTIYGGSRKKLQSLKEDLILISQQTLNMSTNARNVQIAFQRTKSFIQNNFTQLQRNLHRKVGDLQKLVKQVKQQNKCRTQQLNDVCSNLKLNNLQLKEHLEFIQRKIQGVQNILGITTAHHKHYI